MSPVATETPLPGVGLAPPPATPSSTPGNYTTTADASDRPTFTEAEPLFMCGDPLDVDMLKVITAYMRAAKIILGHDTELIYVEFAERGDASEPLAIHVFAARDGVFVVRRDCRLWLDPKKRNSMLMSPSAEGGHFAIQDGEVVNLPGRPAKSTAAGFARAIARLREIAAAVSEEEARCCTEPLRRAA